MVQTVYLKDVVMSVYTHHKMSCAYVVVYSLL